MTKLDIVNAISEQTGLGTEEVYAVVEAFTATVKDNLLQGNEIFLRGFGSFLIKTRKERTGRNILQNTTIFIPERKVVVFKPAIAFAKEMKGEAPAAEEE
ncbi:MAG: integration host factor subunit beta [Bacteroidaceae bacterium]|nr:integration host factor subunit beta [Bacteroidaceae bacterium]MCR4834981.1 integration host factor subunit beta [Bacteroidaceae bacterium]